MDIKATVHTVSPRLGHKNLGKTLPALMSLELKWASRSSDLSPIKHLWNMVEEESHIADVQLKLDTNKVYLMKWPVSVYPSCTLENSCY